MADTPAQAAAPTGVAILSDAPLGDASRDYFGFRVYAEAIASLVDNDLTDTPLTIALSAPWGGGKTSVARMVWRRLTDRTVSRGGQRPVLGCWFDAWLHSDAEHLGAALATAVTRTADQGRPAWRRLLNPVPAGLLAPRRRARRRVLLTLVLAVIAALVVVMTPLSDPVGELLGLEDLQKDDGAAAPLLTLALLAILVLRSVFPVADAAARFVQDPGAEASKGSMALVKEQLGRLIDQGRRGGRLVIYVDDLERCAPERALEVCEVASQLLSHEGVVTLLVADMQSVAAAADERYREDGAKPGGTGRRYLEKIVQLQVVLPAPHRDHIRRLLRGEDPDAAFRGPPGFMPTPRSAGSPPTTLAGFVVRDIGESLSLWAQMLTVALGVLGTLSALGAIAGSVTLVLGVLLAVPLLVIAVVRGYLAVRARGARREEDKIREIIRVAVNDQQPQDEVERRVLQGRSSRYESLALDLLEGYRLDHTPELECVARVIVDYPPPRPRGAKRMLNHARLLTQIARARGIFGGEPELVPEHLGAWIVLDERWPDIAARIAEQPSLLAAVEPADDLGAMEDTLRANGLELPSAANDLVALLEREPRLSDVVARLVHFEPASGSGSRHAEVLGVDRRT